MIVLTSMVNLTSFTWKKSSGKIEQFQQAREGFDALTRRLSEATLNTYCDYVDVNGNPRTSANTSTFAPARYVRQSELRFVSGPGLFSDGIHPTHAVFFHAPLGSSTNPYSLNLLLNTCGFYIEYDTDLPFLPNVSGDGSFSQKHARERFRLMELIEPSENLSIYGLEAGATSSTYTGRDWFTNALTSGTGVSIVAENIIALILLPKLTAQDEQNLTGAGGGHYSDASLAPNYLYDSTGLNMTTVSDANLNPKNQLPPVIQVTLVAIDEVSANRMTSAACTQLSAKLGGLFQSVGDTENASNPGYAQDLKSLQDYLVSNRINYRIFTTNITMKAAKWSRNQTK